jgi:hypothetical protein
VMARPAFWRAVGEVLEIRDEVSDSSDWSSASKRASWVAAKEGMSTASLGAMVRVGFGWFCCWWSCEGG